MNNAAFNLGHFGEPRNFALATTANCDVAALYCEALCLRASSDVSPSAVMDWCQRAHDLLRSFGPDTGAVQAWQSHLTSFFCESPFLERARLKPRNYAGDYLTIQMMYDAVPDGSSVFGRAIDEWALNQPAARAVRNRRHLIADLLSQLRTKFPGQELSVTSLGCGPAAEVFDCLNLGAVHFNLIDIDSEALAFVGQKATATGATDRLSLIRANIIKMALGRKPVLSGKQHAFYSLGVIDYLNDTLVIRLLDCLYDQLQTGGRVLLGNFRPAHPNADFFLRALDWPLFLRSSDELMGLVRRSRFAGSTTTVGTEAEGVQIFVNCIKE